MEVCPNLRHLNHRLVMSIPVYFLFQSQVSEIRQIVPKGLVRSIKKGVPHVVNGEVVW